MVYNILSQDLVIMVVEGEITNKEDGVEPVVVVVVLVLQVIHLVIIQVILIKQQELVTEEMVVLEDNII